MANKHIFDEKFRLPPHIFDRTLKNWAGELGGVCPLQF